MSAVSTARPSSAERAAERSPVVSRSRERQRTVIDAARRLIEARGDRFTIQELVKEAGIALQTFYRLFAGKDELLLAVLDDMITEACAHLEAAARGLPDPVARVRFYVTQVVQLVDREATNFGAQFSTAQHWRLYQLFPDGMSQANSHFSDLVARQLEAARAEGLLPETDPQRDAWFVTQLVMAVYHHYAFADSDRGTALTAEDLWQFCRRALGAGAGT